MSFVFEIILENYPENSAPALKSFLLTQLNFHPSEVSQILSMLPTAILTTDSEEVANDYLQLLNELGVKAHLIKRVLEDAEDFEVVLDEEEVYKESAVIELQDSESLDEVLRELEALENSGLLEEEQVNPSRPKTNHNNSSAKENKIVANENIEIHDFTFQDPIEELTSFEVSNQNDFEAIISDNVLRESVRPQGNQLQPLTEVFKLDAQEVKAFDDLCSFTDLEESGLETALMDICIKSEDIDLKEGLKPSQRLQTADDRHDQLATLEFENLDFRFCDPKSQAHGDQLEPRVESESLIDPLEDSFRESNSKLITQAGNAYSLLENSHKVTDLCLDDELTSSISINSDSQSKISQNKGLLECSTEVALENSPGIDSNQVKLDCAEEKRPSASNESNQKVNYHFTPFNHQGRKFFWGSERQLDYKVLGLLVFALFLAGLNIYLFQTEKAETALLPLSQVNLSIADVNTTEQALKKEELSDSVRTPSIETSMDSIKTEVFNSTEGAMTVSIKKVNDTLAFIELNYKETRASDSLTLFQSSDNTLTWIESLRYSGPAEVSDRLLSAQGDCRVIEKDPKKLTRFIAPCKILITETEAKILLSEEQVLRLTKAD